MNKMQNTEVNKHNLFGSLYQTNIIGQNSTQIFISRPLLLSLNDVFELKLFRITTTTLIQTNYLKEEEELVEYISIMKK